MNYLSCRLPPEALTDCCKLSCLPQNLPRPRCACQGKTAVFRAPPWGPCFSSTASLVPVEFDFKTFYIQPRFALAIVGLKRSLGFVRWLLLVCGHLSFRRLLNLTEKEENTPKSVSTVGQRMRGWLTLFLLGINQSGICHLPLAY